MAARPPGSPTVPRSFAVTSVARLSPEPGQRPVCYPGGVCPPGSIQSRSQASFSHPLSFWSGTAAVTVGVLLQLPMYFGAQQHHYVLNGMPMDPEMLVGMALMIAGLAAVVHGLYSGLSSRWSRRDRHRGPSHAHDRPGAQATDDQPADVQVRALDNARIGASHLRLMAALVVAIAIDTLKPYTFTFILPGVAKEYHLSSPAHQALGHAPVALLPFFGILGTALGSIIWGYLGDRMGRRASILLACMIFIASSSCGAMPAFWENETMCFIMGLAVGGFLPIAYSLLVETVPARLRGQVVVLVAGVGTAAGFLLASVCAHWLIPLFNWRIMWFLGIPTGLVLIAVNQLIPESPRFLIAMGRRDEAVAIMKAFSAAVIDGPPGGSPGTAPVPACSTHPNAERHRVPGVLRRPFTGLTSALSVYGLAWGVVSFGFIVWLPTDLAGAHSAIHEAQVTAILSEAAAFSIPGAAFAAWLYGRSSKAAMVFFAAACASALGLFAALGSKVTTDPTLLEVLLVVLLISMWGSISVLCPYSAEVYPTRMRSTGAGVAAGASKLGGVLALALAVAAISPPSMAGAATLSAVAMLAAAVLIALTGVETAHRRLDAILPSRRQADGPHLHGAPTRSA